MNALTRQYLLTPAAGKRLIARSLRTHPALKNALTSGTIAIIAGTTNGYVAEEVLSSINQADGFTRNCFFRGVTLPPSHRLSATGRLPDESSFPGDVIIRKGQWQCGKTIFDVVDDLNEGDVIVKGANAVNIGQQKAGIYIGHPKAGTIGAALQAVVGRRVRLIIPVGLEKRVTEDIDYLSNLLNTPGTQGPRLLPVNGEIITELYALESQTGAQTELVAAGGIAGAEGAVWLAVTGSDEQLQVAGALIASVSDEAPFTL
ncbi:MAG: hypothetical protein GF398_20320 [Chitinivibrionales bacterium]|nr:hypothetical protein [Chitinivibrionales bacterium]